MAEAAYRVLQLGQETTFGTSVAATTIFPCDPGSGEFELDRAAESPDEDYGLAVRHQAGRGSFGVRLATGSLNSVMRFEDFGHLLQMMFGAPTTTGSGPYVHTFTGDPTSSYTHKLYTVEVSDDTQDWDVTSVVATQLDMSFDALTAPGNAMWNASVTLQGLDKAKSTATASLSAPTALETMEGHLTTLSVGSTATAFGSLTAMTDHLKSASISISQAKPPRVAGGTSDKAYAYGRQKREITIDLQLKESVTSIAEFDIFNVTGGLPTDRRIRLAVDGSGNNAFTQDYRIRYTAVPIEPDVDGERLVHVTGYGVYDSTLASDLSLALTNDVEALP
jgi:hypothetical protein